MLFRHKKKLIEELREFESPGIHEVSGKEGEEYLVQVGKVILDKDSLPKAMKAGWQFYTSLSIAEFKDAAPKEVFEKETLKMFSINYLDGDGNLLVLSALKPEQPQIVNRKEGTDVDFKILGLK